MANTSESKQKDEIYNKLKELVAEWRESYEEVNTYTQAAERHISQVEKNISHISEEDFKIDMFSVEYEITRAENILYKGKDNVMETKRMFVRLGLVLKEDGDVSMSQQFTHDIFALEQLREKQKKLLERIS